jgi:hypothetical protein
MPLASARTSAPLRARASWMRFIGPHVQQGRDGQPSLALAVRTLCGHGAAGLWKQSPDSVPAVDSRFQKSIHAPALKLAAWTRTSRWPAPASTLPVGLLRQSAGAHRRNESRRWRLHTVSASNRRERARPIACVGRSRAESRSGRMWISGRLGTSSDQNQTGVVSDHIPHVGTICRAKTPF